MQLVSIYGLKKYYSDRLVLDIDKFEILENEKIGLVGENGSGKTTLIKALIGKIDIDEGQVYLTDSYSYIAQNEESYGLASNNKIKSVLNAPDNFEEYLSGGEKIKLKITNAFKEEKKLIIADEPTSNLDEQSTLVLEDMLKKYSGAMILVSHDRALLDSLCEKIVEIEDSKLKVYYGNYTTYLDLKEKERNRKQLEFDKYIFEKNRLEYSKMRKINLSNNTKKTPKRMGNSEARLHKMGNQRSKQNIDRNAKSIQSRIDKLEIKEKPKNIEPIKIYIKEGLEILGKNVLEISNLTLLAGKKILLNNVSFKIKKGKKIALLGQNGCGKTTLIKEIIKDNNSAISINPRTRIGHFSQNQNNLLDEKSILDNIKISSSFDETFIRINLNLFGFNSNDIYKNISTLSGGERVKVALCKVILEDNNLLILDEPTNYLDIVSLDSLEKSLKNTNKTMLIVSHDRTFIDKVCDYIIEIKDQNIEMFNGSYNEYIENKINRQLKESNQKNYEEKLILENRMSNIISMLCIESNIDKKAEYEKEYELILTKLKMFNDKI